MVPEMKSIITKLLFIIPYILLFGCQDSVNITHKINKNGDISFSIQNYCCCIVPAIPKPMISSIVFKESNTRKVVWSLNTMNLDGIPLKNLTYGIIPELFIENKPVIPLLKGHSYIISIFGSGISGSYNFKYDY